MPAERHRPPVLAVDDVEAAARWWRDGLGFEISFLHRPLPPDAAPNYAVVERDDVEVHLARRSEVSDRQRIEITIVVVDLDDLHTELSRRGLASERSRGSLAIADHDGNRIVFRSVT